MTKRTLDTSMPMPLQVQERPSDLATIHTHAHKHAHCDSRADNGYAAILPGRLDARAVRVAEAGVVVVALPCVPCHHPRHTNTMTHTHTHTDTRWWVLRCPTTRPMP
jgi:hypothetical protein